MVIVLANVTYLVSTNDVKIATVIIFITFCFVSSIIFIQLGVSDNYFYSKKLTIGVVLSGSSPCGWWP